MMKIALLNLPFDNNYGGNLQRYALMKILQEMGHDVTHIFQRISFRLPLYRWPLVLAKRLIKKIIFRDSAPIFREHQRNLFENKKADIALPFYEKYIKHTAPVRTISDLNKVTKNKFDGYIVGSDQVWREDMTRQLGIDNYFFAFAKNSKAKKIAYAVSLGVETNAFPPNKLEDLSLLYSKFNAVSYRELSAKQIFERNGWDNPKPQLVLDPTLLLETDNYDKIISENETTVQSKGKIYCYVLDQSDRVKSIINEKRDELHLDVVLKDLNNSSNPATIPQWLCDIKNAEYVITDSYHGTIFSILFRKPFLFLGNERRGNTRMDSLFSLLGIDNRTNDFIICDNSVYEKIRDLKQESLNFLSRSLS